MNEELYTEKEYLCEQATRRLSYRADSLLGDNSLLSDNNRATIKIVFAYSPGGKSYTFKLSVNSHQRLVGR